MLWGVPDPYPIRVQEVNEAKRSSVAWPTGFLAVIPKSEFFQYEVYSSIFNYISFRVFDHYLIWQIHHSSTSLVSSMLISNQTLLPLPGFSSPHLHTLYSWYNDSITSIFHHRCFDITFAVRALLQHGVPRGHGDFCEDLELLMFTTS